ncbi:hypothetical protein MTO96_021655, partial [Rhipicephalus appendiculatus]
MVYASMKSCRTENFVSFCSARGCPSTDGRDDIFGGLPSEGSSIGHMPGPIHCSERDKDDIAEEPLHQEAPSQACESGQAVETSPQPACELGHVADKSIQVQLLNNHEASQANVKTILSTSASQTEPQAVSS